jgi:hypothetical protein
MHSRWIRVQAHLAIRRGLDQLDLQDVALDEPVRVVVVGVPAG